MSWIHTKLAAAEALWQLTNPPHIDYALVMDGEADEEFFMTGFAQECEG